MSARNPFKVEKDAETAGENWFICFGNDGINDWYITTDHIHASELWMVTDGPQVDAELVCRLLNEHYNPPVCECSDQYSRDRLQYGDQWTYCPYCGRKVKVQS